MAKKTNNGKVIMKLSSIIAWVVGVLVSLSVGSGMAYKVLTIPYVPPIVTIVAGWIVIVGTILGIIVALFEK